MRFHRPTNVHLGYCLDHLVFKLYLRIGDVHLDTLYQEQLAYVRLILLDIHVQVEEV
jgi:hypothetical protein